MTRSENQTDRRPGTGVGATGSQAQVRILTTLSAESGLVLGTTHVQLPFRGLASSIRTEVRKPLVSQQLCMIGACGLIGMLAIWLRTLVK